MTHALPRTLAAMRRLGRGRRRRVSLARTWPAVVILALCSCATGRPGAAETLDAETELAPFVDEMVAKHGFDRSELADVMGAAMVQKGVLEAIARPAESLSWHQYRPIFVTADRISQGARFWQAHESLLERAESEYGVPAEIIVAIIGVESRYGRHQGRYRVLDSLATLTFRYPKRSEFFRSELEQYLLLTREEGLNPKALKGSYAGAMGIPQFISSSYRRYAVDFDDDQVRDLLNSRADAIGSVANYLKVHGWRRNTRVALPATVAGEDYKRLLAKGPEPSTRLGGMADYGVVVLDVGDGETKGALIELSNESDQEHWVVLRNFYAITRYNHSNLYAMAVFQLSREIRASYMRLAAR